MASDTAGGVVVVYNRIANERHKADLELPTRELRNFVRELEERAAIRRKALAEMIKWHGPDQRSTMPFKEFDDLMNELRAAKLKLIALEITAKTDINAMVIAGTTRKATVTYFPLATKGRCRIPGFG